MSEPVDLSPLDDIEAISFGTSEEYYYPETFYCHQCGIHWHHPWFATRAQIAAATYNADSGQNNSCLIYALRDTPGLKTLRGQHYDIGFSSVGDGGVWIPDTAIYGIFFIKNSKQKMRLAPKET